METALGMIPMLLLESEGSASGSTPIIANVSPLLVYQYARMMQLNPSIKRDIRGPVVESKSSYWVLGGGRT